MGDSAYALALALDSHGRLRLFLLIERDAAVNPDTGGPEHPPSTDIYCLEQTSPSGIQWRQKILAFQDPTP